MFVRIEHTRVANIQANLAAQVHRATDELEQAKIALQRRGYVVFANAVVKPGCELIRVGRQLMTPEAVIAYAERYFPRPTPQQDSEQ